MPLFFNGRLWITPAVISAVDDSAMFDRGLTVPNVLAIIGRSEGGTPHTALRFGSPQEAALVLRSGELLKAVSKAFDPSPQTGSPETIVAIRVNPALQSTLTLLDGSSADAIAIASTDYGLYTKQVRLKVETGTNVGKKVTVALGNSSFVGDDLARDALVVEYEGSELTATVTVTGTTVVLAAPSGSTVATITLAECPTIQELADQINAVTDFVATIGEGQALAKCNGGLDIKTATSVLSPGAHITGNVQAVVDWVNSFAEGFLDATRSSPFGNSIANIGWTFLTGGSDGTVDNTAWQNCFDALQAEDVQYVVPLSSGSAIHAMADTHVAYMSNVGRLERRAFVGMASGSNDAAAKAAALALDSDRTALLHIGYYDYDETGALVLYPPYQSAAIVAAGFAGQNPGNAMTNKALKVRGLERKLRIPTDTDGLIQGGVLCLEVDTTIGSQGFKVTRSNTTWLLNNNYNRVEVSVGIALDFTSRNVRDALNRFKGAKGSPQTLTQAIEIVKSVLTDLAVPEPTGPAVLVGDEDNPPFKNIIASITGDVMRVEFQASPVIPINFVTVVIHAVPWSGKIIAPKT